MITMPYLPGEVLLGARSLSDTTYEAAVRYGVQRTSGMGNTSWQPSRRAQAADFCFLKQDTRSPQPHDNPLALDFKGGQGGYATYGDAPAHRGVLVVLGAEPTDIEFYAQGGHLMATEAQQWEHDHEDYWGRVMQYEGGCLAVVATTMEVPHVKEKTGADMAIAGIVMDSVLPQLNLQ